MIVCVTLNPCLDKTLRVPSWKPGDLVRGLAVREVVGGKGNNVARALMRLGRVAQPATFLGGAVGERCASLLRRDDGFQPIVVETRSETRVILTVHTEGTADQTAFFDPDGEITSAETDEFLARVRKALAEPGAQALSLSGSSPSAATHGLYSELISIAQGRRIPVFLDTYGPALEAIWGFWPTAIQVNRGEAAGRMRQKTLSDREVFGLLDDWCRHGVSCAVVTDGPGPVLIRFKGGRYRATPPPIQVLNPIGSGDSFLAGLIDAWLEELDAEACIRRAIGCAVANAMVWDAGAIDPAQARYHGELVKIEPLGRDS